MVSVKSIAAREKRKVATVKASINSNPRCAIWHLMQTDQ